MIDKIVTEICTWSKYELNVSYTNFQISSLVSILQTKHKNIRVNVDGMDYDHYQEMLFTFACYCSVIRNEDVLLIQDEHVYKPILRRIDVRQSAIKFDNIINYGRNYLYNRYNAGRIVLLDPNKPSTFYEAAIRGYEFWATFIDNEVNHNEILNIVQPHSSRILETKSDI